MNSPEVIKRGVLPYQTALAEMREFTSNRTRETPDEIWVLQHPAVYTLGQAGDPAHILNAGSIPVVQSDRGGQVTYHGPGQLILYLLIELRRYQLGVRSLVELLEDAVITLLKQHNVVASSRRDAPGVYVDSKKIAALGLRIRRGCSFHGLSVNIDMDLEPFERINPCGFEGLQVTQLKDVAKVDNLETVADQLVEIIVKTLTEREVPGD